MFWQLNQRKEMCCQNFRQKLLWQHWQCFGQTGTICSNVSTISTQSYSFQFCTVVTSAFSYHALPPDLTLTFMAFTLVDLHRDSRKGNQCFCNVYMFCISLYRVLCCLFCSSDIKWSTHTIHCQRRNETDQRLWMNWKLGRKNMRSKISKSQIFVSHV